jgi:hypothetical protein
MASPQEPPTGAALGVFSPSPKPGWWTRHGTKILGAIVALVGILGDSLSLIVAYDPKHAALWSLIIGIGGAVIRRGFVNSANQA